MIRSKRRQDKIPRKVKKARSGKYKFSVRKHPIQGVLSFALGMLSFVIFMILCLISGNANGKGGLAVGAGGVVAMLLSMVGFILAIVAFRKRDIHYRFPVAGCFLNGILILIFVILYILGMI